MSLAVLLTVLNSPWATGIATVLWFLTSGGGLICGPEPAWGLRVAHYTVIALCLLVLGAAFLHALGWRS